MQKETFHILNRFYLLFACFSSISIPLLSIDLQTAASSEIFGGLMNAVVVGENFIEKNSNKISIASIIFIIYISIVFILTIRLLVRILNIYIFCRKSKKIYQNGYKIFLTEKNISPFSFMNLIFFNTDDYQKNNYNEILKHEVAHVNQKHSIDIIIVELLAVFQWFNPIIYFYKKALKSTHEYLSDKKVIEQGFDSDEYKLLLIKQKIGVQYGFTNNFNKSLILKRITMINQTESRKGAKLKVLFGLPILFVVFILFSFTTSNELVNNGLNLNPQDTIYKTADEMPVYPGGEQALVSFVAENVKYPERAIEKREEGKVFVSFSVNKNGEVGNAKVVRSVSELLDEASINVVNLIPNFDKPGYKKGNAVSVWYTLPISFQLK